MSALHPLRLPLLLAAALVGLLVHVAAADAAPAKRPFVGVQALSVRGHLSQAFVDRRLDAARRLRVDAVRVEVSWADFEPDGPGRLDPVAVDTLDRVLAGARARGLGVVAITVGSPCWASAAPPEVRNGCTADSGEWTHYGPADPEDYVRFATWLVRRHRAALDGLVVWNEPDHRNELYWRGPDKARRYVDFVRAAYAPLKQAAPDVQIYAGAFVGADGRWLQALYDAGFRGHYDALTVHFYDLPFLALRQTRAVMRRNGDRAPVVIGETGWTSCRPQRSEPRGHVCVDRAAQARFTIDLLRGARRAPWLRGVLVYTLQDAPGDDFGLVSRTGRLKPAGRAVRRELARRRPARVRRLTARLRAAQGGLRLSGRGPAGDLWQVQATSSRARLRGWFRIDRRGRYSVSLPPALGTRGVTVVARSPWYRQRALRRR